MKNKTFASGVLTAAMVVSGLAFPSNVFANQKNVFEKNVQINYALGKQATAQKSPISYWGPDKLVDGKINRDAAKPDQSRWSSEDGAPGWAQVDLGSETAFDEIKLAFELDNVEKFHIETSVNGKEYNTVFTSEVKKGGHPKDTKVTFENEQKAKYVKVVVDKLIDSAYPSVSLYEIEVLGTKQYENLAGKAKATSNGEEANSVQTSFVNDGDMKTRWGSTYGVNEKWIQLDFDEAKTIQSTVLEWERKTPKDYKLEAFVDGQWKELKHYTSVPKNYTQVVNFDQAVTTNKLKLTISDFITNAVDREGKEVDYPTVSLHEWEVYSDVYPEDVKSPEEALADIVASMDVTLNEEGTKLVHPKVPAGYELKYVGADYEQVIDAQGNVLKPLVNTNVVVNYEVTDKKTGKYMLSPDYTITVPGKYNNGVQNKPRVIPELQQWYGKDGEFKLSDNSKVIVKDIKFAEAANLFAKDYKNITGKAIEVVTSGSPKAGDFVFDTANENLEKETYYMDVEDYVTVKADDNTGAYWATRSILQILKQNRTTMPKGIAKDYPKFKVRGFMLDVGRLPVEFSFVKDLAKTMTWYKLNDLHLHLNDNSFGNNPDGTKEYAGFRLESSVPNLTTGDVVYSKKDFRQFILDSRTMGLNIVPEFDQPGHAAAFTRAKPEIKRGNEVEYLDVENPETLKFVKSVFAEYMTGENPVFPKGTVVQIGTDEYKNGNKEAFRKYQDDLLKYIRDDLGYTPRVWGSQSENSGETPITVDGVQMNMWFEGYANPKEMYEKGYDMINTKDGDLYIVPGVDYYHDYLNQQHIYGDWKPNVIAGYKVAAGHKQMLGSNFALWNDMTGKSNDNGTTDVEMFDRINDIIHVFGSKLWGDIKDYSLEDLNNLKKSVNIAPNADPLHEVDSKTDTVLDYNFNTDQGKDKSGNGYDLTKQSKVSYEKGIHDNALKLNGKGSYVETPLDDLGISNEQNRRAGNSVDFWVKRMDDSRNEQILFESEIGAIKAVQKETGKFGFSRYQKDYSFDYTLPVNEWTHIRLVNEFTKTTLYVNGKLTDVLQRTKEDGNRWASIVMPLERIGSKTNGFTGYIDDVVISKSANHNPIYISELEDTIAKVEKEVRDENLYTVDTYKAYTDKLNAAKELVANHENVKQENIDAAQKELLDAYKNLTYKEADYSKVDLAIEKVEKLNKADYKDFSKVEAAIKAVVRNKNITEQKEVDAMAQAIEDAIKALEKKSTQPLVPLEPSKPITPWIPLEPSKPIVKPEGTPVVPLEPSKPIVKPEGTPMVSLEPSKPIVKPSEKPVKPDEKPNIDKNSVNTGYDTNITALWTLALVAGFALILRKKLSK